jgi:PQQ-like domain
MAYDGTSLYIPDVNLGFVYTASTVKPARSGIFSGTGELLALNPETGSPRWVHRFPTADYGAATVSNDVVFTSTFNGKVYALDSRSGALVGAGAGRRQRLRRRRRQHVARRRRRAGAVRQAPVRRPRRVQHGVTRAPS